MSDRNNIIQLIKSSVLAIEPQATMILYGSYAHGDNRQEGKRL
jgi:hypothetical protein